ncbi:MAG: efflux RND transporter periplasmic adaptor subunit [Verrucomicrobia bacterium]|nr:efflux RND transporter periplasmic adaptor subunit [Verrucomicrobiota bacterium]
MKLKIVFAVVIVLLVLGALAGVKTLQIRKLIDAGKSFAPPPETISATVAREENWQGTLTAIGSITAVQGVTVTPDIPGTVREIAFESGAVVAKDALLVRLDTSSEEAQLRATEAQVEWFRISAERARKLRADNTVSQAELDSAEAALKQQLGNADTIRATIAKKTIRAPFAGRLGLRLVNLGQYLDTGKPIVSLQSLQPVYAEFSLPQQDLARLSTGMPVRVTTDAYPDKKFEGVLTAMNPDLDQGTRSVRLQATFTNPEQLLRPGMFARVEVLLPEEQKVLVVPATAVLSAPYGDSVYVIESKPADTNGPAGLLVRQQFVRTGRARGDFLSVVSGLKPGDRIVSAGLFKLRNNMPVVENNNLEPKPSATPRPADS